jgi:hypothetical protein
MKNTLMILVGCAIFGAIMVGCASPSEGNTDPGATATATGTNDKKPMAGGAGADPSATTPAAGTDANAPAPAAGTDANAPAAK